MDAAEVLRLGWRLHRISEVEGLEFCFAVSGWHWATFAVGFFALWEAHWLRSEQRHMAGADALVNRECVLSRGQECRRAPLECLGAD